MKLNRKNLNQQNNKVEKIIQFGEGNFLRAFADWMVQQLNETTDFNGSVVVVQPIEKGMTDILNEQNGLYHTILKGIKNGTPVKDVKLISSVSRGVNPYTDFSEYLKLAENPDIRFIISNTTEAGIAFDVDDLPTMQPPKTFPAKLTLLLHQRFNFFKGSKEKGLIFLPCELIENNASELKSAIKKYCELWHLNSAFVEWIDSSNTFCNTLVDRIVPGFSAESAMDILNNHGIEDKLCVDAEQFYLWVVEGAEWIKKEFPTDKAGLNVIFANDIKPYRSRKVRLLNGPHTLMTPVAFLSGIESVKEAVEHPVIGKYITDTIQHEITPTINLPEKELNDFAGEVLDRFKNPFVKHSLLSISLNSVSKFKTRLLPSLKGYIEIKNKLPERIVLSLAALIVFYSGRSNGKTIPLNDDAETLLFFKTKWNDFDLGTASSKDLVAHTLQNKAFWGEDLSEIKGMEDRTHFYLEIILKSGINVAIEKLNQSK